MLLRADICRAGPQKRPRRNGRSPLKSVAALVADTTCWIISLVTALQYRRGLKTSSSGPMLSRFRTMLFSLGQSSNSDVDVGFPRGQQVDSRDFIDRRASVNFLLWLGFGVHLRSKSCSGSGLAYNYVWHPTRSLSKFSCGSKETMVYDNRATQT